MKKLFCLLLCVSFICSSFGFAYADSSENNKPVTRLEAIKLLTKILPAGEGGEFFSDTDDADVAYYRKAGIVQGYGDNTFGPDTYVKTQDFLLMLKRTLDVACPDLVYDNQKIKYHIDHSKISSYAQSQIALLSAIGIYSDTNVLNPSGVITYSKALHFTTLAETVKNSGLKNENGNGDETSVPILMYHVIDTAPDPDGPYAYLYVSPKDFEAQIKYLSQKGYTFLFPEEISVAHLVPKPVVITFDDGNVQTYTNALPILKKYNAKATLYMITDYIDNEEYCTSAQLKEMSDCGTFRIYSHTKSHPHLSELSIQEIEEEFALSNKKISSITNREVTSVAFPYGDFNDNVLSVALKYYKTAFGVLNSAKAPMTVLSRHTVDGTLNLSSFISIFETPKENLYEYWRKGIK